MPTTTISRCGGTPSGGSFPVLLLQSSPDALWKQDELAGTTAFDSLAGHHDAAKVGITPLWGQIAAPPGGTAPKYVGSPVSGGFATAWAPNLGSDFSMSVFARAVVADTQTYMGQGNPPGGQPGFCFYSQNIGPVTRFSASVWTGGTNHDLDINANVAAGTWVWLSASHAGALWTFYVNGAAQAATYSGAYVSAGFSPIWLGWDGIETYSRGNYFTAWGAVWSTRAVSASEWAAMYAAL